MNQMSRKSIRSRNGGAFLVYPLLMTAFIALAPQAAVAQSVAPAGERPTVVLVSDPPASLKENIYTKPVQIQDIAPAQLTGPSYFKPTQTVVGRKLDELQNELMNLQGAVTSLSESLGQFERDSEQKASIYYANVATINTQLQVGTTPGNPRLIEKIGVAEQNLEALSESVAQLNQLSVATANAASEASFLLETVRATYALSGAVEEDHVKLAQLEDAINNTLVAIERVSNTLSDDITRATTYLSSERSNLRTLALAVSNGDLYGKSLANRPFSSAVKFDVNTPAAPPAAVGAAMPLAPAAGAPTPVAGPAGGAATPLVKIRFDQSNVEYEQPVYVAVNEALARYPNAHFELVAVTPTQGNAAQVAIESTRARRNAERVLRTLTQMGLPLDRIDLSYTDNAEAQANEVHLYIR